MLNRQSTGGGNPAHLVIDETNALVIVANYATGSLAVLPRNTGGSIDTVRQLETLEGATGPHKVDQTFSHPHQVADRRGQFLVVPDKGLDRIFSFRLDGAGKARCGIACFSAGQARRGAASHRVSSTAPFAYVAHELDSSVGAYRYDPERGSLTAFQAIPSVPDSHVGANTAAEIDISPSGRFVFVSNRGSDTIGTFAVDASSGRLRPLTWTPSQGKGPRFFAVDPSGALLYAANENSDTIVAFRVDAETGHLLATGQVVQAGSPVCVLFSTT